MKVEGTKELPAPREVVWNVINDPAQMAKLMPGVESFAPGDPREGGNGVTVATLAH